MRNTLSCVREIFVVIGEFINVLPSCRWMKMSIILLVEKNNIAQGRIDGGNISSIIDESVRYAQSIILN